MKTNSQVNKITDGFINWGNIAGQNLLALSFFLFNLKKKKIKENKKKTQELTYKII